MKKISQIPKIWFKKNEKKSAYVYTLRSAKYNERIYFILSIKFCFIRIALKFYPI